MTTSIGTSIAALLGGTGSIDTGALVTQLVNATRGPRDRPAIGGREALCEIHAAGSCGIAL